jgi:apolipoprotein N-acyltransferase
MALPFLFDSLEWACALSIIPWLAALEADGERAFRRGWLGGFVFVALSLSWLHAVAWPTILLEGLYWGLYPAFFAVVTARARHRLGIPIWVVAPLSVLAHESLVEHASLVDCTWLLQGYAAWRCTTLMQISELGGPQLVSALLVLIAAALLHLGRSLYSQGAAALRQRKSWIPCAVTGIALAAAFAYGYARLSTLEMSDGPRVALVQGNVLQSVRNDPRQADAVLLKHVRMTEPLADEKLDFVAWPETTANHFVETDPPVRRLLGDVARSIQTPLLVGGLGTNPPPEPASNSLFLFDASGELVGRSDKRFLVPLAETLLFLDYVPALRDPICDYLSRTMHFRPYLKPGAGPVILRAGGVAVGPLICMGDTLPRGSDDLRTEGAEILLTVSNEAWFGNRELDQHLAMATVRSIETRLPMARATNTGITCIIDPAGRVTEILPRNVEGVLIGTVPVTESRAVPVWARRVLTVSAPLVAIALLVASFRKRRRSSRK